MVDTVDIFISYTNEDRKRVWPLVQALRAYGWRVWWDQDMRAGARVDEVVLEQLKSARAIVAVWSSYCFTSNWIFGETEGKSNPVFPVLLDDGIEPPIWLRRFQPARLARWSESFSSPEFRKLVDDIAAVLGPPDKSTAQAQDLDPSVFKSPLPDFKFRAKEDGTPAAAKATRSAGESFKDPTIEFPRTVPSRYRFPSSSLQDWSKRLQSERLIGVRSPNDEITSAAVDAVLELDDFKSYDLRLLAFDAVNQERTDLSLDNFIRPGESSLARATIVVVDSHGALPFIQSILCGPHRAKAITEELRYRDLLFIVQIGSRYQRDLAPRFDTFRFGCWDIDWLEPLLTRLFPNRAPILLKQLLEQRNKGYWGSPHHDLEFHEALQAALAEGLEGLQQALDRNDSTTQERLQQQPALVASRSGAPYCRGILFCAAFFPGLDVTEFKKLCLAIVGDTKIFVPDTIKDTDGRVRATPRMSTLKEEWSNVADGIFEQCGLKVAKSQGDRAVTFVYPEERASLRGFFDSQAHFFADTARKLWASGFFFGRDSSTELVEGMTGLFVAAIDHDTSQKQPQWLSNLLFLHLSAGGTEALTDFQKAILDLFVLSRISRLLRGLLGTQEFAFLVKTWFDDLLLRGGHLLALRLATYLKYTDGFDYLYWLKRFCNEGSGDVRNETYLALYQHARQSSAQIWDFLSGLESWLPVRGRTAAQELSKPNEDALRLIIEYSFDTGNELKPQDAGKWPSRYPLFRDMALDPESAAMRLGSLISWVFHPALTALFEKDDSDAVWEARGQLILLWSNVLLGFDVRFADDQAKATYQRILTLCWQHTDQPGRAKLCALWRNLRESLREKQEKLEGEAFAYLRKWIRLIENLENDFRTAGVKERESSSQAKSAS